MKKPQKEIVSVIVILVLILIAVGVYVAHKKKKQSANLPSGLHPVVNVNNSHTIITTGTPIISSSGTVTLHNLKSQFDPTWAITITKVMDNEELDAVSNSPQLLISKNSDHTVYSDPFDGAYGEAYLLVYSDGAKYSVTFRDQVNRAKTCTANSNPKDCGMSSVEIGMITKILASVTKD